ncbi:hypothetical protein [Streptomyces sp. NPDC001404]|uniref:hypothetical protein n=1 Tax=Streptomyces sp. NPDC001404 TaxID=3364571 RepID=UPI0036AF9139
MAAFIVTVATFFIFGAASWFHSQLANHEPGEGATPANPSAPENDLMWGNSLDSSDGRSWYVDRSQPEVAPPGKGDITVTCEGFCDSATVSAIKVAAWDKTTPPDKAECADLLNTHPARSINVPMNHTACFMTHSGRLGYLVVNTSPSSREITIVYVWIRRPLAASRGDSDLY